MGASEAFDVVVVGARIAGSVTAATLADLGHRVLMVDTTTFPSDTISTHFFRGGGLGGVLARLGLLDATLALGSPPLTRQYDYVGDDPRPAIDEPQDPGALGYCLSVRRRALDHLLVDRARSAGVEVREGTRARSVTESDGRVVGLVTERDGVMDTVRARIFVGADGRASPFARMVGAIEMRREPAARAMYFRYVRSFRGPGGAWDGPEFSVVGDEMVYAFPSDDDVTCIAVSIDLKTFRSFRSAPDASFEQRLQAHPGLADRYRGATPEGRLLGSGPKDAVIRRPFGQGWALVGDAAISQDPWSGLGMDNAGRHATFLAEAVDDWLTGKRSEVDALDRYGRRRDEHALPGFEETATLGRDLSLLTAG